MWWGQSADTTEENPQPSNVEVRDLQDQFQSQQKLIVQLKEMLKSNEQQLLSKEKEVEEYATKLSNIRSRSKAFKKARTSTKERDSLTDDTVQPDISSAPIQKVEEKHDDHQKSERKNLKHGNLILLRKQVEENRIKYEQRGKELTENKRDIEEMVEHLRSQLEEREQTIKELKGEFEGHLPNIARPDGSSSVPEEAQIIYTDVSQQDIYVQLQHKDNRIFELNNRILQLENNVLDLQENLKEKDCIIEARTKAITLMSDDLSRKSKATLDTLDETREEMRLMQQNFVTLELQMKQEKEKLNRELEGKNKRLLQLEEHSKLLESARFDLSTRNAELQAKIVHLQTEMHKMSEVDTNSSKVESLGQALDEANKQLSRVKTLHKTKVKNLNKQLEALKRGSENSEVILQLQQRIAELEEEKVSEDRWKQQVVEMQEKLQQQSRDLDTHVHCLSLLESEKLDLLLGLQEKSDNIASLEGLVKDLKSRITDLENVKVSSEMKLIELEEQIDTLLKERNGLLNELQSFSDSRSIKCLHADTDIISAKDNEDHNWDVTLEAAKQEKDSSNLELSLKPFELELQEARKVIDDQKEIIHDLQEKVKSREEEFELQIEMISKLEHMCDAAKEDDDQNGRITEIVKELAEMSGDLEEWKNRCSEVEDRLKTLEVEKLELKNQLEDVINENTAMNTQLKLQKEVSEDLALKVKDQNKIITTKEETISKLKDNLNDLHQCLESKDNALLEVSKKFQELQIEFANKSTEGENNLAVKIIELELLNREVEQLSTFIKDKDSELKEIYKELQHLFEKARSILQHFEIGDSVSGDISVTKGIYNCLIKLQEHYELCLTKEKESNATLNEYEIRIKGLIQKVSDIENIESQMLTYNYSIKSKDEELASLKQEYESISRELEMKREEVSQSENKIKQQSDKIKKLCLSLKSKTAAIKNYEVKEKEWEENILLKTKLIEENDSKAKMVQKELEEKMQCLANEIGEKERIIKCLQEKCESLESQIANSAREDNSNNLHHDYTILEQELKRVIEEKNCVEDQVVTLNNKISEKEREVSWLNVEIQKMKEDIDLKKEEINELNLKIEFNTNETLCYQNDASQKIKSMLEELSVKDSDIQQSRNSIEELKQCIYEKECLISELQAKIKDFSSAEELTSEKLEKELQHVTERNKQALAAMEAKLQEQEAYTESLEQELTKSHSRIQHLEEGICGMEERRQSLEVKVEALGEMLQEAGRKKEEVEESEEILEKKLAAILPSVEGLKKKLNETLEENDELNKKIDDLKNKNELFAKITTETDISIKHLQMEVERLASFELAHSQSLEKVEVLEMELKRASSEFDRLLKEKMIEQKHYSESVESDLKNLNNQLETAEADKRKLMENYEKLNDYKLNLEEEVELLNDKLNDSIMKINSLENEVDVAKSELEKVIQKEALNEKVIVSGVKEMADFISQTDIVETDVPNNKQFEDQISYLSKELQNVNKILSEKESEINNYQKRLLQIQFSENLGGAEPSDTEHLREEIKTLVQKNHNLEHTLFVKDGKINELEVILTQMNSNLENMKSSLECVEQKLEDKMIELYNLQMNMTQDKQNDKSMISNTEAIAADEVGKEFCNTNCIHINLIQSMETEIERLNCELLRERAKCEISSIIDAAVETISAIPVEYNLGDNAETNTQTFNETGKSELEVFNLGIQRDDVSITKQKMYLPLNDNLPEEEPCFAKSEFNDVFHLPRELEVNSAEPHNETIIDTFEIPFETSLADEDDGWGWGSNEARLEDEHISKKTITLGMNNQSQYEIHIAEIENKLKEIECEKSKIVEELHAAQIRNGKLLKRLKDFKLKNESLLRENQELASKNACGDLTNLDSTIEDELKIQIDNLEKEFKDCKKERDLLKIERDSFQKKIDVLTSANERFLEMKERQDIDIQVYEYKNKELSNKIEGLEWKIGELMEEKSGSVSNLDENVNLQSLVEDLQEQLQAMAIENESLRSILEEQKSVRLLQETENNLSNKIISENTDEKIQLSDNYENVKELKGLYLEIEKYKLLEQEHCCCLEKIKHLQELNNLLVCEKSDLLSEMNTLKESDICHKLQQDKLEVEQKCQSLKNENFTLTTEIEKLKSNCECLRSDLESVKQQNLELNSVVTKTEGNEEEEKIKDLTIELKQKLSEIEVLKQMLESEQTERFDIEEQLNSRIKDLHLELAKKMELIQQLEVQCLTVEAGQINKTHSNDGMEHRAATLIYQENAEENNVFMENQNEVAQLYGIITLREREIEELKERVLNIAGEYEEKVNLKDNEIEGMKRHTIETERQLENLMYAKDEDIQNLRIQLQENERMYSELLEGRDKDIKNFKIQLADKEDRIIQLTDELAQGMELLMNAQEINEALKRDIEQYKQKILVNEDPIYNLNTDSNNEEQDLSIHQKDESNGQQEELDMALYMLHQRDVRCDELTLELMQLLEERDTLQLRLSNALRMNEELRSKLIKNSNSPVSPDISSQSSSDFDTRIEVSQQQSSVLPREQQEMTGDLTEHPKEDIQVLATKLSQLHRVDYRRDVTLKKESEQRHSEQIQLLQQRTSGIVLDANYTLSRDVQSPSTVLLNWLRGRSTPKVVHL